MNIQDSSDIPQMVQTLLKQKETLLSAQIRKGEKPIEMESRGARIYRFTHQRNAGIFNRAHEFGTLTTFIPPAYTPCTTSYDELNKIMLADLVLETHHRGTYIALRSVTPADKITAISTMAEDEAGDIVFLSMYYQEHDCIDEFLQKGAILIIKDPYLKVFSDGGYGMRVDHLSDVHHLAPYDVKTPLAWQPRILEMHANYWKEEGNQCFKELRFYTAIEKCVFSLPANEGCPAFYKS